ncbi:hypothetical protein SAMN02745824_1607 [Parasphingorhabdus marina DSM 22363]|uniref:Uncharacterized protein n=1 Tax=Parasphingorhabdus marina DSM 22363 TaxID=1123272 RepID=A0A1N6D691_9SPHN|nr:hypothetical protein [Parasphingorhabdus marina]SIN66338.1 hypothetical protein SAMN02745824_1607 [Parasphingorhabdus marina DSM 22363]
MTKFQSLLLGTVAAAVTASSAFAADAARNERLYDANGASVAKVNRVADDGDVMVIYKGKVIRVQAETLSKTDGKLMTSLTRKELRRMK